MQSAYAEMMRNAGRGRKTFEFIEHDDGDNMNDIGHGGVEFWQVWGTALGGAGHEVGHSFGLAHAPDLLDLMNRGFDVFNRLFAPLDGNDQAYPEDELPFFGLVDENGGPHLDTLDQSRWFN